MDEKTVKTTIRLLGNDYTITSSDSEEYVHRVAFYVDKKLSEIAARNSRLSTNMAAVLASVNIADELFKLKDVLEAKEREIELLKERNLEENRQLSNLKIDAENQRKEIERLKITIAKLEVKK